jgi:hypothetical protein
MRTEEGGWGRDLASDFTLERTERLWSQGDDVLKAVLEKDWIRMAG